jgi:flagellar basal body rod protein FlgB
MKYKFYIICSILCLYIATSVAHGQSNYSQDLGLFFTEKDLILQDEIRRSSKKHALYAYNIANVNVPGFKPVLMPEDQKVLAELIKEKGYKQEIILEFLMARMAENAKRYNAYIAILKNSVEQLRRVVSLGK